MKIVDACRITGRGEALITDAAFTRVAFVALQSKKKVRIAIEDRVLEMNILSTEAVLKTGGREFLGFLVPFFVDEKLRTLIVNRQIELT